jgi:hypothetical protein
MPHLSPDELVARQATREDGMIKLMGNANSRSKLTGDADAWRERAETVD